MRSAPSPSSITSACVLLGGALLVTLAIATVGAEEPVGSGEDLFERMCASCHGPGGFGDGAAAKVLAMPPSNLAHLLTNAGGTFPFDEVARAIDGRELRVKGSDMPIWGDIFSREFRADTGPDLLVQKRIHELTRFVETLQE